MKLKVIFDGTVFAAKENISQTFRGGQFLYFDPQLEENQSLEIGIAFLAILPGLNDTHLLKVWDELQVLDTDNIVPIPREISESDFEFYIALGTSIDQPNFRAYLVYSDISLESLTAQLDELKTNTSLLIQHRSFTPNYAEFTSGIRPYISGLLSSNETYIWHITEDLEVLSVSCYFDIKPLGILILEVCDQEQIYSLTLDCSQLSDNNNTWRHQFLNLFLRHESSMRITSSQKITSLTFYTRSIVFLPPVKFLSD
jgi:hypothetical protein